MSILLGPMHAASVIDHAPHLPFCFAEYVTRQDRDTLEEIVPDLHPRWSSAKWEKHIRS